MSSEASDHSTQERTKDEIKQFEKDAKAMFELMDKNGDKCLTTSELAEGLKSLGFKLTNAEVKTAASKIDTNKNGRIEYREFQQFMLKQYKQLNKSSDNDRLARRAFRTFDRDGNGVISKSELGKAMKALGEKMSAVDLQKMMDEADTNQDGQIDYEEFLQIFNVMNGRNTEHE